MEIEKLKELNLMPWLAQQSAKSYLEKFEDICTYTKDWSREYSDK